MRWSVSKSINFGLFKLNFSKSGVTISTGLPGARVSLNTKGEAGVRVGKKGFAYTKKKKVLPNLF